MEQLSIAFKIWCSVEIFETKYNKNNIVKIIFLASAPNLEKKSCRQIRYLGQNITNLQISTFDANVTPGMRKKDIL